MRKFACPLTLMIKRVPSGLNRFIDQRLKVTWPNIGKTIRRGKKGYF